MQDKYLTDEHLMFRAAFRTFLEREVKPYHEQWEKDGIVDRAIWNKAGEQGFLAIDVPEKYGGMAEKDFRFNAIISEEIYGGGWTGLGFPIHSDMAVPYLQKYAGDEQKARWLPGCATGETIVAIAMTEPNTGSDLASIQTTAVKQGDKYIINGQKTFISNGIHADLAIVACKTAPNAGHKGISLVVVERGMAGFEPGRNLEKIGMHAQDTAELYFQDVAVPVENLLGEEGRGFYYLVGALEQQRLTIAMGAMAGAEAALAMTINYCGERSAFGRKIGKFQNSRFKLAEMQTECTIGRIFIDDCILAHNAGKLTPERAAMAKYWATDLQIRIVDQGLQLHGGYGYMTEYPIARAYVDSRAQSIYGGTNEIMKEIIGRNIGF
ncbi:MAG TPA: acyl-CoA dehydrogenase [Anaerolineae bacterium]|nr:acyl-CoA dehydrogenase [Anaerolineae bacterium]